MGLQQGPDRRPDPGHRRHDGGSETVEALPRSAAAVRRLRQQQRRHDPQQGGRAEEREDRRWEVRSGQCLLQDRAGLRWPVPRHALGRQRRRGPGAERCLFRRQARPAAHHHPPRAGIQRRAAAAAEGRYRRGPPAEHGRSEGAGVQQGHPYRTDVAAGHDLSGLEHQRPHPGQPEGARGHPLSDRL